MKVNASKTFFRKEQLDYPGYTISEKGISPITKKVDAIRKIALPKTRKQLRSFSVSYTHLTLPTIYSV